MTIRLSDHFSYPKLLRTLVFEIAAVLTLPALLGIDGVWLSIILARFLSACVAILFLITNKKRYHH